MLSLKAWMLRTLLFLFLLFGLTITMGYSGVVYDGTLGTPGSLTGPTYGIASGRGTIAGSNLFHSFRTFSVDRGEIARFSGPASIQNVISRVTGGSASTIDGTISSGIEGANLYFINPWGVMFGPNASLDVSGSFHVSTASHLKFSDGGIFSAVNPSSQTVLTSAPPSAFGFLGQPSSITVDGSRLAVPDGKEISFVGGALRVSGASVTSGGRINLASLGSPGEAALLPSGIDIGSAAAGDVTIDAGSTLSVSAAGAGSIFIRGNRFVLAGSTLESTTTGAGGGGIISVSAAEIEVKAGGSIGTSTSFDGWGGDIVLSATDSIAISGRDNPPGESTIVNTNTEGRGDGGNISLDAPRISVTDGASVTTSTRADGKGGDVRLTAGDSILVSRGNITPIAWWGSGSGGDISLSAPRIDVRDTSVVATYTYSDGDGGDLRLSATDSLLVGTGALIQTLAMIYRPSNYYYYCGRGNAGSIDVSAPRIEIGDRAEIGSGASSSGKPGNVALAASDSILIRGDNGASGMMTGVWSQALGVPVPGQPITDSGNISLCAPRIEMTNGGEVSAGSGFGGKGGSITLIATESILMSGTWVDASAFGAGDAGSISLSAPRIEMTNGAQMGAVTRNQGKGGEVRLSATESIILSGESTLVTARAYGTGDAGNVSLSSPRIELRDGGQIDAVTYADGRAGNVTLSGGEVISLSGGSAIQANTHGNGDGGNIFLSAPRIEVASGADIVAGAYNGSAPSGGTGKAGDISLSASDSIVVTGQGTSIFANTETTGRAGNIAISARRIAISDGAYVAAVTDSAADAGSVTLSASDSVAVYGGAVFADTYGNGNAGSITVSAPHVEVRDGAILSRAHYESSASGVGRGGNVSVAATESISISGEDAEIKATTGGSGSGGSIRLSAPLLTVDDRAVVSASTSSDGPGGNIMIDSGRLAILDGASISSESKGTGTAGDITIRTGSLKLDHGSIVAETVDADGGNIVIITGGLVDMIDSDMTARVRGGTGNGGNITIDSGYLVMDPSSIVADAEYGNGGNISILCDAFIESPDSIVSASSRYGNSGSILITSPVVNLLGSLTLSQGSFLDANTLSPRQCIPPGEEGASTFRVRGREGLPLRP